MYFPVSPQQSIDNDTDSEFQNCHAKVFFWLVFQIFEKSKFLQSPILRKFEPFNQRDAFVFAAQFQRSSKSNIKYKTEATIK